MNASPHLGDELLSAHLDGEDVEGSDHLADCARCQARLDALRSAAAAVAAPVPPAPPERRDAAVAAASAARVVPLHAARRRQQATRLLGAAAAVVAVLGAFAVLRPDDGPTTTALTGAGSAPTFEGGDLGDQSDENELALRMQAAVEPATATAAPAAGGGATTGESDNESGAADDAGAVTGTPEAATVRRNSGQASKEALVGADPHCTEAVARDYGRGLGRLLYRASLRWKGTPAVVLVYPVEGASGPLDHRVLVMAQGDCRLLVAQTI